MQLLFHLENSLKNNMLVGAETDDKRDSRQKQIMGSYIIDLLLTLSKKSLRQPSLVNFLFSDSRQGSRKGAYMPMQVLLQLLMREQMRDDDYLKATLRHCLVLQLRIPSVSVRTYLSEESELTQILAIKLGFYLEALPDQVELLSNTMVLTQYPEDQYA